MKYCSNPFKYCYVVPNGNVFLCGWSTLPVGNLLESDLETIWMSEKAQKVRQSIKDGSFCYCKTTNGCPFCENNSLVEKEEDDECWLPPKSPEIFNLAIDYTCNHSCPSCREKIFVPDAEYKERLQKIVERLMPYLDNAELIGTNGQGDFFASPFCMHFLENLHPSNPNIRITLETNGVLADPEHWSRIAHLAKHYIRMVVTPNSFERATYKYLSGGHDDLDKLLSNLAFIRSLREKGDINDFAISIVVQDRNFRELPAFARRCLDEFHADSVSIKPIYKWFKMSQEDYLEKDILNPCHPYFEEYQDVLKDPRLDDKRLFFWGAHNIHASKMLAAEKMRRLSRVSSIMLDTYLDSPTFLSDYILSLGYKTVGIYGYGRTGRQLHKILGNIVKLVIDRRAVCAEGNVTTILTREEKYPDVDVIVVTPFYEWDEIYNTISCRTCADILSVETLLNGAVKKEKNSCVKQTQ